MTTNIDFGSIEARQLEADENHHDPPPLGPRERQPRPGQSSASASVRRRRAHTGAHAQGRPRRDVHHRRQAQRAHAFHALPHDRSHMLLRYGSGRSGTESRFHGRHTLYIRLWSVFRGHRSTDVSCSRSSLVQVALGHRIFYLSFNTLK